MPHRVVSQQTCSLIGLTPLTGMWQCKSPKPTSRQTKLCPGISIHQRKLVSYKECVYFLSALFWFSFQMNTPQELYDLCPPTICYVFELNNINLSELLPSCLLFSGQTQLERRMETGETGNSLKHEWCDMKHDPDAGSARDLTIYCGQGN